MKQKFSCPFCGDTDISPWALGKWKCRACSNVFNKNEAKELVPKPKPTSRPTRTISDRQERINARQMDGVKTIASGATPVDKGDVKASEMRMECKSTGKKSFILKRDELRTIAGHTKDGEIPVFAVEFRGAAGETNEEFYVLPKGWFMDLMECWRERDRNKS